MRGPTRRELLLGGSAAILAAAGRRQISETADLIHDAWLPLAPRGIVVHHSATEPPLQRYVNAAAIEEEHRRRGMRAFYRGRLYHIAYHYVILPDGTLEPGRPEGCRGGHTRSYRHNFWTGICLIGWFDTCWKDRDYHRPTPRQMHTLVELSADLVRRHGFGLDHIWPHRRVNQTQCPGRSFPMAEYLARVAQQLAVPLPQGVVVG